MITWRRVRTDTPARLAESATGNQETLDRIQDQFDAEEEPADAGKDVAPQSRADGRTAGPVAEPALPEWS